MWIESYNIYVGDIPPWNKIGGDISSRNNASLGNYLTVVKAFSQGTPDNFLVSRCTIRELADNATYAWFESQLHGLRMMMLSIGMSFEEAVRLQRNSNPYFQDQWDRITTSGYLEKELIV